MFLPQFEKICSTVLSEAFGQVFPHVFQVSHNIDPFCFLSFVLDLIDKALVFQVKDKDHEKIIVYPGIVDEK